MQRLAEKYLPWLFVLPALVVVFGLTLYPLFNAIYQSTRGTDLTKPGSDVFIGLDNYRRMLNYDLFLSESWKRSLIFTAGCLALQVPLGLGLALLLNRPVKGQKVFRAIFILPLVTAPIAIGQIWRMMYHYEFGILKYLTTLIFGASPNWTADPNWAMISIIIYDTWQWTPFVALIILAGLQSLPQEPYESATIYGASAFQKFRYITLPKIRPLIGLAAIFRMIDSLKTWDPVWAITQGGPGDATQLLSYYLYRIGLQYFWIGYACANALVFLYVVIVISTIALKRGAKLG
ncbi:MAG: sugar ABC transporter permease [Candidatus Bathyarchaeia archaeon]